jgi:hypothetical protein
MTKTLCIYIHNAKARFMTLWLCTHIQYYRREGRIVFEGWNYEVVVTTRRNDYDMVRKSKVDLEAGTA